VPPTAVAHGSEAAGLRAGASGFLLKDTQPDDLADAIRTVAAGDAVLAPGATAAGRSNGEIAASLHLSGGTVKIHVGRILARLGLRDRVQAVVLAYESALIIPGTTPPNEPGDPR